MPPFLPAAEPRREYPRMVLRLFPRTLQPPGFVAVGLESGYSIRDKSLQSVTQ
jgi:hypothetical protein